MESSFFPCLVQLWSLSPSWRGYIKATGVAVSLMMLMHEASFYVWTWRVHSKSKLFASLYYQSRRQSQMYRWAICSQYQYVLTPFLKFVIGNNTNKKLIPNMHKVALKDELLLIDWHYTSIFILFLENKFAHSCGTTDKPIVHRSFEISTGSLF